MDMLDRRFIRENPGIVRWAVEVKGLDADIDAILTLDAATRRLQTNLDAAQTERKRFTKRYATADAVQRAVMSHDDTPLAALRAELASTSERLHELLLRTPAIPWSGAPVGADESANVRLRTVGEPPTFDCVPLDHVALLERRGWAEFARARRTSGERAYALRGDMVLLERAIHSYTLDVMVEQGFLPISVPSLVQAEPLVGTGMFPKGREEIYELPADGLFLAGTGEVALVGMHGGEILNHAVLPVRYAGISACFRREIGSAGRDVRGLLRVHQFEKIEQFVICAADEAESARWHAALLANAETILQGLELAYEVVECCTGDMGQGKFRMNDINTWFPALDRYRETHSCSTLHDWQARRANLRYRDANGAVRFAHTLNNTAAATPRLLAAVIENHQTTQAEVRLPVALRPYLGGREVL